VPTKKTKGYGFPRNPFFISATGLLPSS